MGTSHSRFASHLMQMPVQSISDLVDAIGGARFEQTLIEFMNAVCGAQYCALYRLENDNLSRVADVSTNASGLAHQQGVRYLAEQHWRRDPVIMQAQGKAACGGSVMVARVNTREYSDPYLRDIYRRASISERMIVGRGASDQGIHVNILSLLRPQRSGPFCEGDIGRIQDLAGLLIATVAKHAEMTRGKGADAGLESVAEIERCISKMPDALPMREAQVCARILSGRTAPDIAADLGIGEESVATYRKRAYRRLNVASRHELLIWYLQQRQRQGLVN